MGVVRSRTALGLLVYGLFVLLLCPVSAVAAGWQWLNPIPQGNTLHDVWGTPSGDLFAVGSSGAIVHFDGVSWRTMDSPTREPLAAVWGVSGTDVYAVGANGTILHYDGTSWVPMHSGTDHHLWGVWASGPCDVFAVGGQGTILHYDGKSWNHMDVQTGKTLRGVWGISPNLVFAVGYGGTLLKYDGNAWVQENTPTRRDLVAVHGVSALDVYAVGHSGTFLRFDGVSWKELATKTTEHLVRVRVGYDARVTACSENGAVLEYDGEKFSLARIPCETRITGMWGMPGGRLMIVGERATMAVKDGPAFSPVTAGTSRDFHTLVPGMRDDILAVGTGGALVLGHDGSRRTVLEHDGTTFTAAWKAPGSDTIFMVGSAGAIVRIDRDGWEKMDARCPKNLFGVWGSSARDVFAVGAEGTILHYDGIEWSTMASGVTRDLRAVWGSSSSDVYAVGDRATMLHYDGSWWTAVAVPTPHALMGIWGSSAEDAYAVGEMGTILHFDGGAWHAVDSPTLLSLNGVWGSSATDVYAVGELGAVLHFDGGSWRRMEFVSDTTLRGVWGSSGGGDVYVSGDAGAILYYGNTQQRIDARYTLDTGVGDPADIPAEAAMPYLPKGIDGAGQAIGVKPGRTPTFEERKRSTKSLAEFLAVLYDQYRPSRGTEVAASETQPAEIAGAGENETTLAFAGNPGAEPVPGPTGPLMPVIPEAAVAGQAPVADRTVAQVDSLAGTEAVSTSHGQEHAEVPGDATHHEQDLVAMASGVSGGEAAARDPDRDLAGGDDVHLQTGDQAVTAAAENDRASRPDRNPAGGDTSLQAGDQIVVASIGNDGGRHDRSVSAVDPSLDDDEGSGSSGNSSVATSQKVFRSIWKKTALVAGSKAQVAPPVWVVDDEDLKLVAALPVAGPAAEGSEQSVFPAGSDKNKPVVSLIHNYNAPAVAFLACLLLAGILLFSSRYGRRFARD